MRFSRSRLNSNSCNPNRMIFEYYVCLTSTASSTILSSLGCCFKIHFKFKTYFFLNQKRRRKRNFGPYWKKWPKGIVPYVFDSSLSRPCTIVTKSDYQIVLFFVLFINVISFLFPDVNRGYFLQAIELFNQFTCVRWKPNSTEVAEEVGHQGYVLVRRYNLH